MSESDKEGLYGHRQRINLYIDRILNEVHKLTEKDILMTPR